MTKGYSKLRFIEIKLQQLQNELLQLSGKENTNSSTIENFTEQRESLVRFKSEYLLNEEFIAGIVAIEDDRRLFIKRLTNSIVGLDTHLVELERDRTLLLKLYSDKKKELKKWELLLAKYSKQIQVKNDRREDEQCDEQIRFANYSKRAI